MRSGLGILNVVILIGQPGAGSERTHAEYPKVGESGRIRQLQCHGMCPRLVHMMVLRFYVEIAGVQDASGARSSTNHRYALADVAVHGLDEMRLTPVRHETY